MLLPGLSVAIEPNAECCRGQGPGGPSEAGHSWLMSGISNLRIKKYDAIGFECEIEMGSSMNKQSHNSNLLQLRALHRELPSVS